MAKRILVPTDGSDISKRAVLAAVEWAKLQGADLVALSVKEPFPYSAISEVQIAPPQEYFDAQDRLANERVDYVAQTAQAAGLTCHCVTKEAVHPWEVIVATAKAQACDLIVMASHGRHGLNALLLVSETQKVLTHTDRPVLVIR